MLIEWAVRDGRREREECDEARKSDDRATSHARHHLNDFHLRGTKSAAPNRNPPKKKLLL